MATIWLRHLRYSLLILCTLISTFYLLFVPRNPVFHLQDNTLVNRVQRSHAIYEKVLAQRQGLIKKFGPNPKDIALCVVVSFFRFRGTEWMCSFPADKPPWPPYTVCKSYISNSHCTPIFKLPPQ